MMPLTATYLPNVTASKLISYLYMRKKRLSKEDVQLSDREERKNYD